MKQRKIRDFFGGNGNTALKKKQKPTIDNVSTGTVPDGGQTDGRILLDFPEVVSQLVLEYIGTAFFASRKFTLGHTHHGKARFWTFRFGCAISDSEYSERKETMIMDYGDRKLVLPVPIGPFTTLSQDEGLLAVSAPNKDQWPYDIGWGLRREVEATSCVHLVNLETKAQLCEVVKIPVTAISISRDSSLVAVGDFDGRVRILSIVSFPKQIEIAQETFGKDMVLSLDWQQKNELIAIKTGGNVIIWDVSNKNIVARFECKLRFHILEWSSDSRLIFNTNENTISEYVSSTNSVAIAMSWSNSGRVIRAAAWNHDSSLLAVVDSAGIIDLLCTCTWKSVSKFNADVPVNGKVRSLRWNDDSTHIVISVDNIARIFVLRDILDMSRTKRFTVKEAVRLLRLNE